MFGRDWKPARATIVARKNIPKNRTSSSYEFIADIQPDEGGPAFRATFRGPQSAYGFLAPQAGGVVASPASRAATPGTAADAEMKAADDEFQVAVAAMKSAVDAFKRAKDSGDTAEAGRLKPGVAAANAEVQRLNTEFRRLAALRPDWTGGQYPARPPAGSEAEDPLDRLQKLAGLHDRGVLTDAEFAAQKAKILNAG